MIFLKKKQTYCTNVCTHGMYRCNIVVKEKANLSFSEGKALAYFDIGSQRPKIERKDLYI